LKGLAEVEEEWSELAKGIGLMSSLYSKEVFKGMKTRKGILTLWWDDSTLNHQP